MPHAQSMMMPWKITSTDYLMTLSYVLPDQSCSPSFGNRYSLVSLRMGHLRS